MHEAVMVPRTGAVCNVAVRHESREIVAQAVFSGAD
jgi:hypothetical protein